MKNLIIKNLQDVKNTNSRIDNAYKYYDATILKMSASQDIPAQTYTKVNFDTVINDPNGNFDEANKRINIKKDSFYLVTAVVMIDASDATIYSISIHYSGDNQSYTQQLSAGGSGYISIPISNLFYFNKDNYVEVIVYFNDAKTIVSNWYNTRFSIIQIPLKF